MKLKQIFNLKNIKHFIEGYSKFYYDKLIGLEPYIQEQIMYRMSICKDDCMVKGECKYCGCSVPKKMFVIESCNEGKLFPNIMRKEDWELYKIENNIKIK